MCVLLCAQVRAKQLDIAGVEEQMSKLDSMLKEARSQTDKVQKEYNVMSEKVGSTCTTPGHCTRAHGQCVWACGAKRLTWAC